MSGFLGGRIPGVPMDMTFTETRDICASAWAMQLCETLLLGFILPGWSFAESVEHITWMKIQGLRFAWVCSVHRHLHQMFFFNTIPRWFMRQCVQGLASEIYPRRPGYFLDTWATHIEPNVPCARDGWGVADVGAVAHYHLVRMLRSRALEWDKAHDQSPERLRVLWPVQRHACLFCQDTLIMWLMWHMWPHNTA